MISSIKDIIFNSNTYDVIITIIAISLAFTTMYNKIKYFCLEKAAEKVAEVEKDKELTGSQKFAKVVLWINQELPKLFKNKLFNIIVEKLGLLKEKKLSQKLKPATRLKKLKRCCQLKPTFIVMELGRKCSHVI